MDRSMFSTIAMKQGASLRRRALVLRQMAGHLAQLQPRTSEKLGDNYQRTVLCRIAQPSEGERHEHDANSTTNDVVPSSGAAAYFQPPHTWSINSGFTDVALADVLLAIALGHSLRGSSSPLA